MSTQITSNQVNSLPRAIPRFDIPADFISSYNQLRECQSCLSKLKLPNIALPRIKILRVVLAQYGYEKDDQGKVSVGGLDLEVHQLDMSLVKLYPIDIKVAARSAKSKKSCTKESSENRKGSLFVTKLPNFGRLTSISLAELKKILDQDNFDLIHLHRVKGPVVRSFVQEAQLRAIPVVMTHHNGLPEGSFVKKTLKQKVYDFLKNLQRNSDYYGIRTTLVSLSSHILEIIRNKLAKADVYKNITADISEIFEGSPLVGVSEYASRIYGKYPAITIGSAIDTEFFSIKNVTEDQKKQLRYKLGIEKSKNIISYHARMTPAKGQIDLVSVASEILKTGFTDFNFVICGPFEDSIYVERLKSEISNQKLDSHFQIIDTLNQTEIRTLLSISSVLTFPTHYESLGRTGIEAMLMRVPVVANNVGGIPGYIKDSETGFIVGMKDYRAMADKILELLKNPELREKIAIQAEKYAQERFDASDIARQYMELCYANMLQRKFSSADN